MARARLLALLHPVLAAMLWPGTVTAAGQLVRITSTLEPARLTMAPGDTVTWRNDDGERHRVRSRGGPVEFDSGDLEPGEAFRVRLSAVGTYPYIDERDDDAERYWGMIVVAESPDPADGGANGGAGGGAGGDEGGAGGDDRADNGAGAPSAATIGMAGRAFGPTSVTIAAGGTVTWRNDDDREHTATSTEGAFDSGVLAEGASFRKPFPTTGTFPFLCGIHPDMTGIVTVVAGAASGGGDGAASAPTPVATPLTTPVPVAPSDKDSSSPGVVTILDVEFAPGSVEVDAGGTVAWRNDDPFAHTTTAADGSFDSGVLEAGETFRQRFPTPGRFAYTCAIHPSMTGVVVVRAASGQAPAPSPRGPDASSGSSAGPEQGPSAGVSAPPDATAPPGPQVGGGAGTAGADGEPTVTSLVSTVLGLALIVGALMVGAGLLLGLVRRGEGPAGAAS